MNKEEILKFFDEAVRRSQEAGYTSVGMVDVRNRLNELLPSDTFDVEQAKRDGYEVEVIATADRRWLLINPKTNEPAIGPSGSYCTVCADGYWNTLRPSELRNIESLEQRAERLGVVAVNVDENKWLALVHQQEPYRARWLMPSGGSGVYQTECYGGFSLSSTTWKSREAALRDAVEYLEKQS